MKYLKLFLQKHKWTMLITLLLLSGQVVTTLLIPSLIAAIVDKGILQGDLTVVKQIGMQMLIVALAGTLIAIGGSWYSSDLSSRFGFEMRSKLLRKSQELSLAQFQEIGVSSMITRSTSDITNLQQTFGMMLQLVVPSVMIVIVSIVMTAQISPELAVIELVSMALLLGFSSVLLKKSNSLSQSIQRRLDKINKIVRESITGVRVIRAFGNERYEEQRSGEAFESYAGNMIRLNLLFAVFNPFVWIMMGTLMAVVLGLGGLFSLQGSMNLGEITAASEYAIVTMGYLMMGVATLTSLPKSMSCLERLTEVLDTEAAITDSDSIPIHFKGKTPIMEFEHVSFTYPGAEEDVISHLSFTLQAGQTTAVIGSTGSGKSTLGDLLLRLHDIQSGAIRLKGVDIRNLTQQELRERIGCVPQKAFLFSGTIAENLRMGRKDAQDSELWNALRIAQAENFVKNLPLGLASPVSQGGTNFSGGQRQRLSIARALVKKVDILLFDDSFSALDVKTDAALRHALQFHAIDSAKLIIAQRVSSIMDADQILVLNEGHLVGKGTHEELIKTCDIYRAIAESQMNRKEA